VSARRGWPSRTSAAAVLGFAATVGTWLLFRCAGEQAWPVVPLLYLPRAPLGLLLALLFALALRQRARLAAVLLALAGLVWLFPLMGLKVNPLLPSAPGPRLRVMSFNVWFGYLPAQEAVAAVAEAQPDLIALQAVSHKVTDALLAHEALRGFYSVRRSQYALLSRFPIRSFEEATVAVSKSGPPYLRATVETPLGPIDILDLHPLSVRRDLFGKGGGLRSRLEALRSGALASNLEGGAAFRQRQLQAIRDAITQATRPVIALGDTNLPGESWALAQFEEGLTDAFDQAGRGFGYTFPCDRLLPWMRLDRALLGPGLVATAAWVGRSGASDHCPLIVDVAKSR
jgi:vancomycin resistance protein VanJ